MKKQIKFYIVQDRDGKFPTYYDGRLLAYKSKEIATQKGLKVDKKCQIAEVTLDSK